MTRWRRPRAVSSDWSCPGRPRVLGPAIADAMTGFYAAFGMMAAALERSRPVMGAASTSRCWRPCAISTSTLHPLLLRGRSHDALQPPKRLAVLCLRMRRREMVALHMSSPEKFWKLVAGVWTPGAHRRSALLRPAWEDRAPGGADIRSSPRCSSRAAASQEAGGGILRAADVPVLDPLAECLRQTTYASRGLNLSGHACAPSSCPMPPHIGAPWSALSLRSGTPWCASLTTADPGEP